MEVATDPAHARLGVAGRIASLHVVERVSRQWGGLSRAALDVALFLGRAGLRADVASTRGADDDLSHLEAEYSSVPVHLHKRSFPARLSASRDLIRWLPGVLGQFQIVEIHGVFGLVGLSAARICRRMGVPYLVRPHGSLDPFDLQKHSLLKRWLGPAIVGTHLRHSAGVVLTAEEESRRLVTFGASTTRHVVPLPVAEVEKGDRKRFRARWDLPDDALVVLFLSRVDYKKGLEFLLPALASLKTRFPTLHFVMVGGGEPEFVRGIEQRLTTTGMKEWTRVCGWLGGMDKADAFAGSDLFALPSRNENFGIAIVEALQCGLPVVISHEVYIHREIADGGAAEVCELNVESCASALVRWLKDPAYRLKGSECARRLAVERFGSEACTRRLEDLYREVLQRAASGRQIQGK